MQRFLPFLPDGEAAGAGGEALAIIADDLEWLLATDAAELWAVARTDASLALLLASFLQYAKRPYEEGFSQQPATQLIVWQRVLPLLHRLVCGDERGAPSKADRAAVLSRLLDLPRLLDICALYGAAAAPSSGSNGTTSSSDSGTAGSQLAQLVAAALQLLPQLASQAAQAGPLVAQNLGQVAEACLTAAGKAGREEVMMQSLQDGVAYLRDTCLTLASFVQAHPPAAVLLLQHGPDLIEALGAVHDQLLPAVLRVSRSAGTSIGSIGGGGGGTDTAPGEDGQVRLARLLRHSCHVELASERLAQQLILHCYCQPAGPAGGPSGSGGGAGSSKAGDSGGSAVARGEALLHGLMLLGHREEESGAGGARGGGTAGAGLSLGQALAQRLGLGGSVLAALRAGTLSLDDAQTDYVAALLGVSSLEEAPGPPLPGGAKRAGGAGGGGGQGQAPGMDVAALKSKIQQVKELLPDFGDGFVAACLQQLGGSPERVLNALLEGTLPAQLASVDRQLGLPQWQAAADKASGAGGDSKGKRAVGEEAPSYDSDFPATLGGGFGGTSAAAAGGAGAAQQPRAENKTAKYLDVREETYREALVSAANAAQWEYEDEYDDSFDDLIAFGADGITEVEGDGATAPGRGPGRVPGPTSAQPPSRQAALQAGTAAFQPGGGRPPSAQQAQQAGRGPKAKGSKLWVLDGRIYNYPKPGAQEVGGQQEAEAALAAAEQAAASIMGMGPGGNKPWRAQQQQQQQQDSSGSAAGSAAGGGDGAASTSGGGGSSQGGRGDGGGGRGGRGGGGRGGGRGDHRFKDQHKAAIGNHHRKDRATAKQGRGMW